MLAKENGYDLGSVLSHLGYSDLIDHFYQINTRTGTNKGHNELLDSHRDKTKSSSTGII